MILDLDHVRGWISSIWLLLYSGGDFLSFDKWSSNFHQHTCHIYGWFSHATKPRFCERSPKGMLSISIKIWRTFAYASFGQGWFLTKVVRILPFADLLWPSRAIIYGHHQRLYRQLSSRNFWWVHSSKLDSVQVYLHVDFLEVLHQRGTKIRWIYPYTLCNFISHWASAAFFISAYIAYRNFLCTINKYTGTE